MTSDRTAALDRAFALADRFGELMRQALAARGLSSGRAGVLFVLHERGPVVQRELSEALRRTARHVTTLVDALEASGHVLRRPHPGDRRATLVELTGRGEAEAARMHAERAQAADALLADATTEELAAFVAIADRLLARIDEFTGGTGG